MDNASQLVEAVGVTKRYPTPEGDGRGLLVLEAVDLSIARGESVAVVGPSGSGKSTLLNILGTLDEPTDGRVVLAGVDLGELSQNQRAELRSRDLGFVFQLHHLLPQCTVLENVLVPTLAPGARQSRPGAEERARSLLERVGLGGRLTHRPGQLSGGECQRVAVVRALINEPKLLLADEPTGSLDAASAEALIDLLVELNGELQQTLVLVTHATRLAQRMGRVLTLRGGKLQEREA